MGGWLDVTPADDYFLHQAVAYGIIGIMAGYAIRAPPSNCRREVS